MLVMRAGPHGALLPALAAYGYWVDPAGGAGGMPCLWLLIFGVRCPGCGLSRANAWLWRGDLWQAVRVNWLIAPVALIIGVVSIQVLVDYIAKRRNHG